MRGDGPIATPSDIRDILFEQHMRQILGPRCGLAIAMFRRIGAEHSIMTPIESMVAEYAAILPHDREHVALDLDHDRPKFVVIEGTPEAVNDDDVPPSPEAA